MQNITVQELKQRMDGGEDIHMVDVREPHENAEFNIGGKLVPLGQIMAMQVDDLEDWKNEEVVVYCKAGMRGAQAALMLETLGFTNVKNLAGGTNAWKEMGHS